MPDAHGRAETTWSSLGDLGLVALQLHVKAFVVWPFTQVRDLWNVQLLALKGSLRSDK